MLPDRLSRVRLICTIFLGPAASLVAVALILLAVRVGPSATAFVPIAIAAGAASLLLLNLVPFEQRGSWSLGTPLVGPATDGLLPLRALRGHEGRRIWNPAPRRSQRPPAPPRADSGRTRLARACTRRGSQTGEVRPEHLLSALASEPRGAAGMILRSAGVITSVQPPADNTPPPLRTPTSPAVVDVKILDRSRSLLTLRGDAAVDTEHLLLALLESGDPTVQAALHEAGADPAAMRQELLARLSPS